MDCPQKQVPGELWQLTRKKKGTHIRLKSFCPPTIAAELGRLHRLSKGNAVGFVFFVFFLIVKWVSVTWLETGNNAGSGT